MIPDTFVKSVEVVLEDETVLYRLSFHSVVLWATHLQVRDRSIRHEAYDAANEKANDDASPKYDSLPFSARISVLEPWLLVSAH